MSRLFCLTQIGFLVVLGLFSQASGAVIGQVDNFEDGTTQGWVVGLLGAPSPAPPQNIPNGGPLGAGDNYLQLTSVGGSGAGNRLVGDQPRSVGGQLHCCRGHLHWNGLEESRHNGS